MGSESLSFGIRFHGVLVAVVPLVAQRIGESMRREFAMGGSATTFPALAPDLSPKDRSRILSVAFTEIDRLAAERDVAYARFFVDPLIEPVLNGSLRINPLPPFGFHETSIATVTVDLSKTEEELFKDIADRRRRYIASALRDARYEFDVFDAKNITDEVWGEYVKLYFEAAGKTVGSPERWTQLLALIRNGSATLFLLKEQGGSEYLAGHLVTCYKNRVYDGISAIRPPHKNDHDIGSVMQWETIRYLKQHGFTHYEIGLLFPSTISESVYSQKELAISHFKALFGGEVLPVFRGEKYYDVEYVRERRSALTEEFILAESARAVYKETKNI